MTTPLLAFQSGSMLVLQETSGKVIWLSGDGASHQPVQLTLSQSHILINTISAASSLTSDTPSDNRLIPIVDIVGSKVHNNKDTSILEIYRYTKPDPSCSSCISCKKGLRNASHLSFAFPSEIDATKWSVYLSLLLRDSLPSPGTQMPVAPPPKKYIVYVNPFSGRGLGKGVWRESELMFSQAGIDITCIITTHANHAFSHIKTMPLAELFNHDCIVIVAGDGLVFEIVNGIMAREDGKGMDVLQKVPLAHIGAGTGNGLCKSALFECGEEYSVLNAAFVAIKGRPRPLDLSKVESTNHTLYSFLIFGWGLISDIDIHSEKFRWMGEMRLYSAALYFTIKKHMYRGKLSMHVPARDAALMSDVHVSSFSDSTSCYRLPPLSEPLPIMPAFDIETSDGKRERASSRDNAHSPLRERTSSWKGAGGKDFIWKIIESEFLLVWVLQTSHATSSMHSGPDVKMDDALFHIMVIENCSRCEMLQLLLAIDNGDHIHHPRVQVYKANAYRLEPSMDKLGIFTLDGESIEYGPIQATIVPGAARIMKL